MQTIYALVDPVSRVIRYIGKASDPEQRYAAHLLCKTRARSRNWIKGLLTTGLKPKMILLEEIPDEEANDAERFWIAFVKSSGAELLNLTNGGDGGRMPVEVIERMKTTKRAKLTPEYREMLSAAHRGKKQPPETIAKRSASIMGRKFTDETRRKISEAKKGYRHPPEVIARIADKLKSREQAPEQIAHLERLHQSNKGRKLSPEHAAKLAASNKTRIISDETREKMRTSHLGQKQSPELIEKRAAALRGLPRSDAVKASMSAGWARRRTLGLKKASPSPETVAKRAEATKATWERKRTSLMACEI